MPHPMTMSAAPARSHTDEVVTPFHRIAGFRLVVTALAPLARFYEAIGFSAEAEQPISADEMAVLRLEGRGLRLPMTLGPSRIELDWFEQAGAAYPADVTAADLLFQHLALATGDAALAWTCAQAAGATSISRDGPIMLPASSGGVTAVKFRDPDGHPLELLQFPPGANPAWRGEGILGIDHSAIVVANITTSCAFYRHHGLGEGKPTLNQGASQIALDGLDHVCVDVVPLDPLSKPPHIELLGYRYPTSGAGAVAAVNDIAATRIIWNADHDRLLRDPDGHLQQLVVC